MHFVNETDSRFCLQESSIPHAGLGVFAKEKLKKGDFLEVIGVQVPATNLMNACTHYAISYKFAARKDNPDRNIIPMGFGGMVNHAIDGIGMNCKLMYHKGPPRQPDAGQAILMFLRDIEAGEELLHYYSDELNDKLKWVKKSNDLLTDPAFEGWEEFLAHGLYGLDVLKVIEPGAASTQPCI